MCGLSEVDVEGEHGMHQGIVVEVSSGLQPVRACVCGGSASGGGEVGGGGGGEGAAERESSSCIHDFQPLSMPGDKSDLANVKNCQRGKGVWWPCQWGGGESASRTLKFPTIFNRR